MTRIIGGAAAATRLLVPPQGTRPTSDKVREALFSTLEAVFTLEGARVADLYAGSGALGLEALSRGAESVVLVERSAAAARSLRANADAVAQRLTSAHADPHTATVTPGLPQIRYEVASVRTWLARASGPFDLVLLDPPYDQAQRLIPGDLRALAPLLSPDALVVVEHSAREPVTTPEGYALFRTRTYGETQLTLLEIREAPQAPQGDAPN